MCHVGLDHWIGMNGRRKRKLFSGHQQQRADTGCCLKDETRDRRWVGQSENNRRVGGAEEGDSRGKQPTQQWAAARQQVKQWRAVPGSPVLSSFRATVRVTHTHTHTHTITTKPRPPNASYQKRESGGFPQQHTLDTGALNRGDPLMYTWALY